MPAPVHHHHHHRRALPAPHPAAEPSPDVPAHVPKRTPPAASEDVDDFCKSLDKLLEGLEADRVRYQRGAAAWREQQAAAARQQEQQARQQAAAAWLEQQAVAAQQKKQEAACATPAGGTVIRREWCWLRCVANDVQEAGWALLLLETVPQTPWWECRAEESP